MAATSEAEDEAVTGRGTKVEATGERDLRVAKSTTGMGACVTDLQGPPSEHTQTEKIRDLKSLARQYARDQGSCDDIHISYLEDLEDRDSDNLRLAQMLAM
jgi:hypothetical protein